MWFEHLYTQSQEKGNNVHIHICLQEHSFTFKHTNSMHFQKSVSMLYLTAQNVDVISINLKCQKTIMVSNKCAINICKTKDVNLGTCVC